MCVCVCVFTLVVCCVQLIATPRTIALQGPLSMGFSKQENWSGLPFPPPPRYLPNPGISPALAGRFFTAEPPGKPCKMRGLQQRFSLFQQWAFNRQHQPPKELVKTKQKTEMPSLAPTQLEWDPVFEQNYGVISEHVKV